MQTRFLVIFLVLCLNACTSMRFPGVYKIDIQQGNILAPKQVQQLKLGMSKEQVRYLLGQPLVIDTFNSDIWNYYYSLKQGNGDSSSDQLKLVFSDNKLSEMSGPALTKAGQIKAMEEELINAAKKQAAKQVKEEGIEAAIEQNNPEQ